MKLTECPVFWQIQSEIKLQTLKVKRELTKAQIQMEWLNATIASSLSNKTIAFPSKVNVTRCKGQKVHKCIKTQYISYLEFSHNGCSQPLSYHLDVTKTAKVEGPSAPVNANDESTTTKVTMYPDIKSQVAW